MKIATTALVCVLLAAHAPSFAAPQKPTENIVFPADAGVLNVRDAQFGAKGDGIADDTAAIQKALSEGLGSHRVVYLPNGTYRVSDTLKWRNEANAGNNVAGWGPFLQLQGQSRTRTIIKLQDDAPGFDDEDAPRAVVQTGSSGSDGNKRYTNGEGNEAFENHLRNFSVDTGKGNVGAVGIDFQASNVGALRHVAVRGTGFCGIALTRRDNGPALLKDVSVQGFRWGVRIYQEIAHFTLEDVTLSGQSEAGLWMRDAIIGARHLHSHNTVPAIEMAGVSLLALFDSDFAGGQGGAAIQCQGTEPRLYVRNLQTAGYQGAIRRRGKLEAATLAEWSSDAPLGHNGGQLSLHLPVRDTPEFYEADPQKWADAGAPSGGDDTAQVQAALDAGKSTVSFRYGTYRITQTLRVPANVKLLQGVGSSFDVPAALPGDGPLLRFAGAKAGDFTVVDRFTLGGKAGVLFSHEDARTLVLRDLLPFSGPVYRNVRGAGPLFLEDVSSAGYNFAPGTQVWARQWNLEGRGSPKMLSDGATVWALGNKHESAETIWDNRNGARLEAWAGFAYTFGADPNVPAALNTDASLALQMAGTTFVPNGYFDLQVKDTQQGRTTELRRAGIIGRGGGATIPLYVTISGATSPSPGTGEHTMNLKQPLAAAAVALATSGALSPSARAADAPAAAVPAKTGGKTFKAPEFFDGEENGKPAGNPLEVAGKPLWMLAQIWPDDPLKRENYHPMNWAGDAWRGAYEFGGQPEGKVAAGKFTLGVRGGWGGEGTMPGNKMGALLFIAPAKGTYTVTGTARAGVWQGDKAAASLSILTSDPKTGKVTRARSIPTPSDTDVPLEDISVELDAGQELVLAPSVTQMYTAANVELRDLQVQAAAPAAPPKVGDIVTINGRAYKVSKADAKPLTLVLQAE